MVEYLSQLSGISGGTPSTTQPIALPWLSPQVVNLNIFPNVLWLIILFLISILSKFFQPEI
jgi:hypothetical protein